MLSALLCNKFTSRDIHCGVSSGYSTLASVPVYVAQREHEKKQAKKDKL